MISGTGGLILCEQNNPVLGRGERISFSIYHQIQPPQIVNNFNSVTQYK